MFQLSGLKCGGTCHGDLCKVGPGPAPPRILTSPLLRPNFVPTEVEVALSFMLVTISAMEGQHAD
jgi:hypothetical protein